jgi:ribosomal protein L37AE/L43A
MVIPESCPACGSTRYKKNGHTRHGKQNHRCKNCERQFSAGAANRLVSAERRAEIANLLRERITDLLGSAPPTLCRPAATTPATPEETRR